MPRTRAFQLSMLLACLLVPAACRDLPQTTEDYSLSPDIVLLGDGSTMDARPGTLTRAVADWLAADQEEVKPFELGRDAFVPGTADLSPEGLGHAADLAILLNSASEVQMKPCTPFGDDDRLAMPRAVTIARFLESRDIVAGEIQETPVVDTLCGGMSPSGFPFVLRRRIPRT